jgi:hypothetical protein
MSSKAALVVHLYMMYGTDLQESANAHRLSLRDVYHVNAYISDLRLTTVRQRATV